MLGGGHLADGLALARAVREHSPDIKWLTLLLPADAPGLADLGDAAQGVTVPAQWLPQVAYKPDVGPTAQAFEQRFKDKYKAAPTELAAAGYAAGLILGRAIEQSASVDPGRVAATLKPARRGPRCSAAADSPPIRRSTGLQIGHELVLRQWQRRAGRLVPEVIWPLPVKTADAAW